MDTARNIACRLGASFTSIVCTVPVIPLVVIADDALVLRRSAGYPPLVLVVSIHATGELARQSGWLVDGKTFVYAALDAFAA